MILRSMSVEPLSNLLKSHRVTLAKLEKASRSHEDGPAMVELKNVLRLRIAALEIALRLPRSLPLASRKKSHTPEEAKKELWSQ